MDDRPARKIVLSNATQVFSNPWLASWLQASRSAGFTVHELTREAAFKPALDVVGAHLQWPEQVLRGPSRRMAARRAAHLLIVCAVLRLRGRRVLWTAHNVESHDHDHPVLERLFWATLMPLVTDVHVMSAAGVPDVLHRHRSLRRCRWYVIPHGDYRAETASAPTRRDARSCLGLSESSVVLMTIGLLRAYKGLGHLAEVFAGWDEPAARLLMWGKAPDADALGQLRRSGGRDPRIDMRPGYVRPDALIRALAACDLVVLPYRKVLNSGSAMLALSAGRPVLVPRTPTFQELAERVGSGWVHLFDGPLTEDDLRAATAAAVPDTLPDLSWCTWPLVSDGILNLWDDLSNVPSAANAKEHPATRTSSVEQSA